VDKAFFGVHRCRRLQHTIHFPVEFIVERFKQSQVGHQQIFFALVLLHGNIHFRSLSCFGWGWIGRHVSLIAYVWNGPFSSRPCNGVVSFDNATAKTRKVTSAGVVGGVETWTCDACMGICG
jgi:hypothetical protein